MIPTPAEDDAPLPHATHKRLDNLRANANVYTTTRTGTDQ